MKKVIVEELSFSDKISGFSKVKVMKPEPDALRSICGEKVQTDKDGNEYFLIPEHQAKYQAELHPGYKFSKGFLTKETLAKLNAESERNALVQNIDDATEQDDTPDSPSTDLPEGTVIPQEIPKHPVKKHRGNPNWGKKHKVQEPVDAEAGHQLTEV